MKLYSLPASLYGFKVALALRLKAVEIEVVPPPGGGYRSAEYRAINPAGTIPCLVDGDLVLAESDAIVEYLDDIGLGRGLRAGDPHRAARARMLSRWHDLRLEPAVRRLFAQVAPAGRDAQAVEAADAAVAAALALIETALAADGPFATGATPSIADCGLAASWQWLGALRAPLGLRAEAGPRLARTLRAMAEHPLLAAAIGGYRAGVDAWVTERTG